MSGAPTSYAVLADELEALPTISRAWRRAHGLSLRQAAKQSGVSFSTITRLENGGGFDVTTAVKIMRWLDGQPPTPKRAYVTTGPRRDGAGKDTKP